MCSMEKARTVEAVTAAVAVEAAAARWRPVGAGETATIIVKAENSISIYWSLCLLEQRPS